MTEDDEETLEDIADQTSYAVNRNVRSRAGRKPGTGFPGQWLQKTKRLGPRLASRNRKAPITLPKVDT